MPETIEAADLLAHAARDGYTLIQRETDTGQLVWAWRRGDDPRYPCFLTRREAVAFMEDRLRQIDVLDCAS